MTVETLVAELDDVLNDIEQIKEHLKIIFSEKDKTSSK